MKMARTLWAIALATVLTGCQQKAPTGSFSTVNVPAETAESGAEEGGAEEVNIQLTDTSMTYGSHRYTMQGNLTAQVYNREAWGRVTFTHVPAGYDEFETVYTRLLGKTPHGAAAMMPMAMEMYARDSDVGERCIRLLNTDTNVNPVVSQLSRKFSPSDAAPANDSYIQRYLPAAVLQGATPENGYSPDRPYTVVAEASVNPHGELSYGGRGRVVYLYIVGGGWDTKKRQVEVVLAPGDNALYKVFNCPSLYTQCKPIAGDWPGLQ